MEKIFTLKELLVQNNTYKTQYVDIIPYGKIEPSKKIRFRIHKTIFENNNVELISNPIIVFELDENIDLQHDYENIFESIELTIGGSTVDRLWNKQIQNWNKIYGFNIEKNDSKIFFPLPFEALNNGNGILCSQCGIHEIQLLIEFSSLQFINVIKTASLRIETIMLDKPNYHIINDYFRKKFKTEYHDKINHDMILIKIKQNQFIGLEILDYRIPIHKITVLFNHNVDRFFIYFQNLKNKSIYWNTQQFEIIRFIVNEHIVLEYDYLSLLQYNSKENLGYELPKGIYEIKWNLIEYKNLSRIEKFVVELENLSIPLECGFGICAESSNYIGYKSGMCCVLFSH